MLIYIDDEAFRISALRSFILLTLPGEIQCEGHPLNLGKKNLENEALFLITFKQSDTFLNLGRLWSSP